MQDAYYWQIDAEIKIQTTIFYWVMASWGVEWLENAWRVGRSCQYM